MFYFHYNIHDLLRLVCYGFRVLGLESAFFCYILSFYFLFHNLSIVSQLKYELYLRSFAQFTVYMDLGSVKHGSVFYD